MFEEKLKKGLPLLAKTLPREKSDIEIGAAKYTGHISFVMQAADVLVNKLGETIIKQLGLTEIDLGYFAATVKLGAYLHDWGKNSLHFQEMLYLKSIKSDTEKIEFQKLRKDLKKRWNDHAQNQMLRHEIISGILAMQVPSFRQWLEQCPNVNFTIAVWAAMGHHLKVGVNSSDETIPSITKIPEGTGDELKILTHHRDFQAVLRMGHQELGLPDKLPDLPSETWSKRSHLIPALNALQKEFQEYALSLDWETRKFVAAVKATVMAADLAGSALPLAEKDFKSWMEEVLSLTLSSNEIEALVNQRLKGKLLRPFQQKIALSPNRVTLVKAGCGTGKTVGAYKWAQKWAENRKLFFCYPTTGTASQGFIDYANGTEIEADLMHSRADLDRELLFSGDSDSSEGIDARLSAFAAWRKKLLVCTVDTVLGLIQNNRKPLYAWAAICQSAFVFDEVHAYDKELFGALLQFLRTFRGAPILLMSASFTPEQLKKIQEVMIELGEEFNEPIPGPKELEQLKRYEIKVSKEVSEESQLAEVWEPVLDALRKQEKVLWVTNSVQSCINLYRQAKDILAQNSLDSGIQPLIYHSRFRYKDRVKKHKAVIDGFDTDDAVLAITTQVCEMSLDLSADLLVSAMAPAAALIQRLGRLNRRMTKEEEGTRLAIIYPWINSRPYGEEIKTGEELIAQLTNKTASQQDLSEIAATLSRDTPEIVKSSWLQGDWCNYPDFLRTKGYTITVLLEQDLADINEAKNLRPDKSFMHEAQGWTVPIYIPKNLFDWKRIKFYPVAPPDEIYYSEETGAEPCKLS